MRVAIVLVAIVLACAGMTTPLHAQQAPYCAQFSDGTSPNCSFCDFAAMQCVDQRRRWRLQPQSGGTVPTAAAWTIPVSISAAVQSDGHAAATAWRHVMTRL